MSLTLAEARQRAAVVSDVATDVHLDLTSPDDFGIEATVRFRAEPGAETFLELTGASGLTVHRDGEPVRAAYDGHRIALPDLTASNEVGVSARMPYVTDGDGMTQVVDPADGERYACALTAMDIAHTVLPCFDQPDLKTTFRVSVTAPAHWSMVSNGPEESHDVVDGVGRWTFGTTPPISTYLFVVCGGPWVSVTWEEPYGDTVVPMGWHARASQRAELERDAAELREVTSRCFQHYTRVFDPPYPFADYQQVFTPGLNWGAMEFPGCVAFRDELLTPGAPTALQRQSRVSGIAHEMAHMWFGDLVTMRWWEDTWLNESFADFMGYEVADVAAGATSSWTACALTRKPTAYRADRCRSTHPVAPDPEDLVDVDTAFGNFDMITYAKGNALLRQLVVWLGEEDFLAGVNAHLRAHAFGNATLADFLDALSGATDRDVRGWAQAWLRTTGYDTVGVTRDGDVPVLAREGSRPHRFTVTAYDDGLTVVGERLVDLADSPVRLDDFAGRVVLPNSADETYAALLPDERSWAALTSSLSAIASPLSRAVVWATAVELTQAGRSTVGELVELATTQLPAEADPTVLEGSLTRVLRVLRLHGDVGELPDQLAALSGLAQSVLRRGSTDLLPAAARVLAGTSADASLLEHWLDGETDLPLPDQDVRWAIVQRLASLGDDTRIAPELERDRTRSGSHAATTARAAVPTPEAKSAAWQRLLSGELSNRELAATAAGLWGWEQAELVTPWVLRYPADCLELGRRSGQAMGKVIGGAFPWLPLPEATRRQLRTELAGVLSGEVPTVLARSWRDSLDDLDRVLGR